jgi:hypothetical protein
VDIWTTPKKRCPHAHSCNNNKTKAAIDQNQLKTPTRLRDEAKIEPYTKFPHTRKNKKMAVAAASGP